MRLLAGCLYLAGMCLAQVRPVAIPDTPSTNLPAHRIGTNDLLSISVYDAPELSKMVRVSTEGSIRLPMLKEPIAVGGNLPVEVEDAVAKALQQSDVLVDPIVTVTVAEYSSRPINVSGAVKLPLVFQAVGPVRLLDAISKAGGLTENAGKEIIVTNASGPVATVSVKALLEGADDDINISLQGGEEVRVPEAGKAFVLGNVKKPGAFVLSGTESSSLLQMLAMAEGILPYSSKLAYVYRRQTNGSRTEVPIELNAVLQRKRPDVEIMPDDILYIPESKGKKLSAGAVERILTFGSAGATALVYTTAR